MSKKATNTTGICQEANFQAFFTKNALLLRNFLYYKFGSLEAVEDVVQEAFIKLWDNCSKVTPDTAKSYLFRIGINLTTSQLRHESVKLRHQKEIIESTREASSTTSPEFILEEKEFRQKLENAINALPSRQREVYLLNRIDGKTYKEIAALSGVSVKAIEKLIHKALLKLRSEIKNIR